MKEITNLIIKGSIGEKFKSLIEDKKKLQKFGVSKDLVLVLNCARVIRNEKVIHKEMPMKYNIPFMVALSFFYLTLFFVECIISNGEIIKE